MKSLLLALILVLSFAATHLVAYGPSGHFIVAYLGRHFSTNETQGRLGRVIHSDDQLFSWANWADRIKSNSSYEWSFPLHYMNIAEPVATHLRINKTAELKSIMRPNWLSLLWSGDVSGFLSQWVIPPLTLHRDSSNQQVNMDVDCENSTCILTALANFTRRLNESQAGTTEHETNLKFLIHLMGDAHQVLHFCGIGRGGNDIECRYNGSTVNLHYVWDDLLLQTRIGTFGSVQKYLEYLLALAQSEDFGIQQRSQWLRAKGGASCDFSLHNCYHYWFSRFHAKYAQLIWDLPEDRSMDLLGSPYAKNVEHLHDEFLLMAGTRLAHVLDHTLHD